MGFYRNPVSFLTKLPWPSEHVPNYPHFTDEEIEAPKGSSQGPWGLFDYISSPASAWRGFL